MKIQILSDLHFEFWVKREEEIPWTISPETDLVVLAGDLFSASSRSRDKFKEWVLRWDKEFLMVAGNHEFYHGSFDYHKLRKSLEDLGPRFHFLENETWESASHKTIFFGATLWSNISPVDEAFVQGAMNDYWMIEGLTPAISSKAHEKTVNCIDAFIKRPHQEGYKKVIVTHHLPSLQSTPPRFVGSRLNCAFSSELDYMLHFQDENSDPVLAWIHGHTHDSADYFIGPTRVLANPYGYPREFGCAENGQFKHHLILEV